jgi:hypothetical protein
MQQSRSTNGHARKVQRRQPPSIPGLLGFQYSDHAEGWRWHAANALQRNEQTSGDIYGFGVFTGGSLRVIRSAWAQHALVARTNKVWGFDSFVGLGEEDVQALRYADEQAGMHTKWSTGTLSTFKELKWFRSYENVQRVILAHIAGTSKYDRDAFTSKVSFVRGFFNESLTRSLARDQGMMPAMYVDIDVNSHRAAHQALAWLLRSGLIVRGTMIGYGNFGRGRLWASGESLAHREIASKFDVDFRLLHSECRMNATSIEPIGGMGTFRATPATKSCSAIPAGGCLGNFHAIFRVERIGNFQGTAPSANLHGQWC